MEEGVRDRKNDRNEKLMREKRQKCPDDSPPVDMEEGVSDRKNDRNEKMMRKNRHNAQMKLALFIWRKV